MFLLPSVEFDNSKFWKQDGTIVLNGFGTSCSSAIHVFRRHVPAITANAAKDVLLRNIERKTTKLTSDESCIYKTASKQFESQQSVNPFRGCRLLMDFLVFRACFCFYGSSDFEVFKK